MRIRDGQILNTRWFPLTFLAYRDQSKLSQYLELLSFLRSVPNIDLFKNPWEEFLVNLSVKYCSRGIPCGVLLQGVLPVIFIRQLKCSSFFKESTTNETPLPESIKNARFQDAQTIENRPAETDGTGFRKVFRRTTNLTHTESKSDCLCDYLVIEDEII